MCELGNHGGDTEKVNIMENKNIILIIFAVLLSVLTVTLQAEEFDSSSPLPVMTAAALETKTASKAYVGYLSLRKKEHEIITELTSPAFERLPRAEKEVKRAENLVALGRIVREENTLLKTYKVHFSNATAIYGKMGPGQIAAARAHLEGIRTAMAADIGERTETAGALARAARLGGLSAQQKKQFRNYVKHLESKQVIEERFRENGRELEAAGVSMEALISYMGDIESSIDLAIAETEANIALNTGAKAMHFVKELSYQLCGEKACTPDKMFDNSPDHSQLMGDFGAAQPESVEDEKTTEDYINRYSRR